MELFNQIFQFVLCISFLIILHEFGHFLPAKLFKTKVEKFYLFFDPWFSLAKKKIGETEYGIGWLPFGGYVKIAGMIDESMDTEQMKQPPQPWEFRSKPAWQRLIIMMGGVTVNFFLAWIIYGALSYNNGETYFDTAKFQDGVAVSEAGRMMGLQSGDHLLKVDGKPAERLTPAMINMLFAKEVTVERDGKEVTFPVNLDGVAEILKNKEAAGYLSVRVPAVVDSIIAGGGAQKAGLQKGDHITSINGQPIQFFDQLVSTLSQYKGKELELGVERQGKALEIPVQADAQGKIGFGNDRELEREYLTKTMVTRKYTLGEAISRGLTRTIDALTMQVKQFRIIFNQKVKGYKNVAGPIGIVKMMPTTIDWEAFWSFTAMFSIWLAFLNLIPIPGLDGGHVVFTLWEMITGKPVPQKVLENAQIVGVIFLLGLMILIFGSDIYKWVFNKW